MPLTRTVEPTPFAPKRPSTSKDQFDTKEKFDAKRPLESAHKVDINRQVGSQRHVDGALYTLEFPVMCPHCDAQITTLRVFRLLRTHVSFTSTLPRKGYVIVCPECERPISSELSGLI